MSRFDQQSQRTLRSSIEESQSGTPYIWQDAKLGQLQRGSNCRYDKHWNRNIKQSTVDGARVCSPVSYQEGSGRLARRTEDFLDDCVAKCDRLRIPPSQSTSSLAWGAIALAASARTRVLRLGGRREKPPGANNGTEELRVRRD